MKAQTKNPYATAKTPVNQTAYVLESRYYPLGGDFEVISKPMPGYQARAVLARKQEADVDNLWDYRLVEVPTNPAN
ncbi:hypothetical protein PBI_DRMANHATTAN_51 [Arthrobacter phage DrManhattan]|uniref:Uncharacterized protein n=1 Tax=Arthrobacter phage DrManhattan TaxID=2419955 RepID=A0A3G2KFQ8_9CAUD|nr:hypothetical protein HOU48_gp51 [Arthrobacter phage DrManhattan]AYN57771.1 hypothetical protein PBI_DRMANHATTAN_51 [Arthrobacter phage DrManhattan]